MIPSAGLRPSFHEQVCLRSEENSTSLPLSADQVRPSRVVGQWPAVPSPPPSLPNISRNQSKLSPVLVGVTDISHEVVIGVFLVEKSNNHLGGG